MAPKFSLKKNTEKLTVSDVISLSQQMEYKLTVYANKLLY